MRALSLTQPWAWLVVHGGKDVENRVWNTQVRGEFLIHAAKGMPKGQYDEAVWFAKDVGGIDLAVRVPTRAAIERGGIVGVAELVGVLPPIHGLEDVKYPWHMPDQFGFRLRNVRPLPFLPCKGALGFWGNFEIRDGKAVQL